MEILNEFIIFSLPNWIFFALLITIVALALVSCLSDKKKKIRTCFLITFLIASIVWVVYGLTFGRIKNKAYEVCFHEPVNINEFLDKYEILEKHGDILKIVEK